MSGFSYNDNTMGGGGYGPSAGYMGPDGIFHSGSIYANDSNSAVTNESSFTLSFSNADKFRRAAEASHPYILTHTNLTFDQIPSVTGVPIKRQFYPPREFLSPGNFETVIEWEEFVRIVKSYLEQIGIAYCLPETIAVFSINMTVDDPDYPNLIFDIHYCPVPKHMETEDQKQKFVIEFRRIRGDAFKIADIFFGLKKLFIPTSQEEEEDEEDAEDKEVQEASTDAEDFALESSSQYTNPPYDNNIYSGKYFSFDDLIEK